MDSSASSDVESTSDHDQPGSSRALPSAGPRSHRDEFAKNNWYFDIRQKLEDLSWSYQTLETEYSFLDKLMQEQKKDLQKAKSWAKHLKAQSSPNRAGNVYYS